MSYIFVGLGNPDEAEEDYSMTRHNTGRMAVDFLRAHFDFPEWKLDAKRNALISKGKIAKKHAVELVAPQTYMNKSGDSIKNVVWNTKKAEKLVVFHDDIDLPIGRIKISFNKSAGGHRGVLSIVKAVKTEGFVRVRIGVSPANAKGIVKKPQGEEAVNSFILGTFNTADLAVLKKDFKKIAEAMEILVAEGLGKAMTVGNQQGK